ncbi:hypothetical protein [Streptomyces sp. NPDC088725]|uniref:hypothetical protein n=1 Tax=Streptomyces sp. NPDC088725 TaxID=3365873 RepID=UPI00380C214A
MRGDVDEFASAVKAYAAGAGSMEMIRVGCDRKLPFPASWERTPRQLCALPADPVRRPGKHRMPRARRRSGREGHPGRILGR